MSLLYLVRQVVHGLISCFYRWKQSDSDNRLDTPLMDDSKEWNDLPASVQERLNSATTVHIISTPYVTNQPASAKAETIKRENTSAGVYTFNPNTDLAAYAQDLVTNTHHNRWLNLWLNVAERTQATGGTCFAMVKGTPESLDFHVEGNWQRAEIQIAEALNLRIEYCRYYPSNHLASTVLGLV